MFLLLCFYELRKLANYLADVTPSLIPCESCTRRCSLYRSGPDELAEKTSSRGRKRELPKLYTGGSSWLMPYVPQQVQRWPDLKSSYQHKSTKFVSTRSHTTSSKALIHLFRYRHKLTYRLRISTIMNALPSNCGYLHARRVEETLNNFIASADTTVNPKHVPAAKRTLVEVSSSEGSEIVVSIFGEHGTDTSYLNSDQYIQVG